VDAAQPNNAPARVRLAKLLTDLGYPETALPHFEKLYEQGRSDPEISISYAEALIRSGRPDRAIDELRRFLEGNPNSLEGLVKLGNAFIQKQRFEEAMAVLEHAVAINRNYAPAYYYAGLAELGRQRQKAEEVERRRRNGEVVPEGSQPDFSKSIVALTTAKDKDPENLVYREALAEALMESDTERNLRSALEQYDTILQEYTKALRLNRPVSRRAEVYYNRGLLASKLGQPRPEILQNFQDALVLDGERADFVARYAEELYRMQSSTRVGDRYQLEAKAYFELILSQHNPNHVRASYYMGRIMLREWDRQRNRRPGDSLHNAALAHFQRVVKHNGADEFPDVLMQIANILRDRGVTRLANRYYTQYLETYRRVHRRDPPNARYVRELMQLKQ
jgi:tetratricopeptide (TPR) repeat protein